MIRVAVLGAKGKMGSQTCQAVEGADPESWALENDERRGDARERR